jgi:hypothetical protein
VLTAQVKMAASEHEIAMMRVRMRRIGKQRADQGEPKWRKAFGYQLVAGPKDSDDGTRDIDQRVGKLVLDVYRPILAEPKITVIACEWTQFGNYGPNGKSWIASSLSWFLRDSRHTGQLEYRGGIIGHETCRPLEDELTWRAAQSVLKAPGRAPGRKSVRRRLLTWCSDAESVATTCRQAHRRQQTDRACLQGVLSMHPAGCLPRRLSNGNW